jgi:hypothetical protein
VAGRYRLVREIGRGGRGLVWLGQDELLGRQVAVKELRPLGLTEADRQAQQARALREARSAARIEHPSAVRLYEVVPATEQDEAVYLIMELVEGPTLHQLIARDGPLPAPRVAGYGLQLLDVLEAAHTLGIVHRDVKPGNIIIAHGNRATLADFGIAHTVGDPRLTTSGVMGTQAYLAPELFDRFPVTPAADLWSLGATLYAAAAGSAPFERQTTSATLRAILLDDLPVPRCDPDLAAIIASLLRRDPAERATIAQARAQLWPVAAQQVAEQEPAEQEPAGQEPAALEQAGPAQAAQEQAGQEQAEPAQAEQEPAALEQAGLEEGPQSGTVPLRVPRLAWDPAAATGRQPQPPPPESPDIPAKKRRFAGLAGRRTAIAAAVVLVLVAAVGGYLGTRSTGGHTTSDATPSPSPTLAASPNSHPLTLRATITVPANSGQEITFSPDGAMLALYGPPSTADATLWNATDGREIASLPFGTDPSDVAFSPNGQLLAVAERFGGVGLWDIARHAVITNLADPDFATGVAFSPDGDTLVVAGRNGVRLWNVASRAWTGTLPTTGGSSARRTAVFSPNGQTLAVADQDTGYVYVWNVGSRSLIGALPPGSREFNSLGSWISIRADGNTLVIGSLGVPDLRFWDISTRSFVSTIGTPGVGGVNAVAFSPADDQALAAVGWNGHIAVWNVVTSKMITSHADPGGAAISDVAFSPDGATLATVSIKDQVYLWKVAGLG